MKKIILIVTMIILAAGWMSAQLAYVYGERGYPCCDMRLAPLCDLYVDSTLGGTKGVTAATSYVKYYVYASGVGPWYYGCNAMINATPILIAEDDQTRYVFDHWSGDYSGKLASIVLPMSGTMHLTANFRTEYFLGASVLPSDAVRLSVSGWYTAGTLVVVPSMPELVAKDTGKRYVLDQIELDGKKAPARIVMDSPHTLVIEYKTQYLLTILSAEGVPTEQWYDAGDIAKVSASVPAGFGLVSKSFEYWQGDVHAQSQDLEILMDSPKTIQPVWRSDYTPLYELIISLVAVLTTGIAVMRKKKPS